MRVPIEKFGSCLLLLITIVAGGGCLRLPTSPDGDAVFYANSFESRDDFQSWQLVSEENRKEDAPPRQGAHCLEISGGCVQPAAYIEFTGPGKEGWLSLGCWGKMVTGEQSATVSLSIVQGTKKIDTIRMTFDEDTWQYKTANSELLCPPGAQLRLEIMVGGFVAASVRIDGLEILSYNQ